MEILQSGIVTDYIAYCQKDRTKNSIIIATNTMIHPYVYLKGRLLSSGFLGKEDEVVDKILTWLDIMYLQTVYLFPFYNGRINQDLRPMLDRSYQIWRK